MNKIVFYLLFLIILGDNLMSAEIKSINIKNLDIPVVYEEQKSLPTFNLQLVFKNSGYIKDGNLSGLANLSSKILNEGTKELGSTKFALELEKRAISINSSCGFETFVIEISSLKSEYKNSLKFLNDLLQSPNYDKKVLEKIKTIQIGTLKRKENDFDNVARNQLLEIAFKNTPLSSPQSGKIKSIEQIKLKDIKTFLSNALTLNNLIVVAGGDIEYDELQKAITPILEGLTLSENSEMQIFKASSKMKEKSLKKQTEQAYIYFASPLNIASNDENNHLAKVASFILGGSGFGSRLMEEIRVKRGLAYSAYGYFSINKSHSYFTGYLQTKLESADEAIKIVKEEINKFIEKGVDEKELQAAKNFLSGSEPLRTETLSQRLSRAFTLFYRGFSQEYNKIELEKIEKITVEELNSFIKSHEEISKLSFSIVRK